VRGSVRHSLASLAALAALTAAPAPGRSETITLRWRHPVPTRVAGFRVQLGHAPGVAAETIDVGRPEADAAGIYRARIELPDAAASYISVVAYDATGAESPRSNEWLRPQGPPLLGAPGRPEVVEP